MLFIGFTACNPPMDKTSVLTTPKSAVNVDSLNVVFLAGWKNKDSAAIISTIADNAVVMNDSKIHTGISSIAKNWISGGVKVLSNIRTVSSIHEGRGDIAYDGGTYSLDLTILLSQPFPRIYPYSGSKYNINPDGRVIHLY